MTANTDSRNRASIARAVRYIDDNIAAPLRADRIARHAGISTFHFQRLFAACLGEPVSQYITARRLEAAARMLASGSGASVLDTALSCGFESHSAFSKAFRARFGLSPSRFRENPAAARQAPEATRQFLITDPPRAMIAPIAIRDLPAFHFQFRKAKGADDGQFFKAQEDRVIAELSALYTSAHPPDLFLISCFPSAPQSLDDAEAVALYGGAFTVQTPDEWSLDWRAFAAGRWAVFEHQGEAQYLYQTWNRVYRNWLPRTDLVLRDELPFEAYLSGPDDGPQPATTTHIYVPIKKA